MSSSPFPYTCELCGAEGLTDEGMRSHTLEAHVAGRKECPFCDCAVPQAQLVGHVQKAHLHYLTPERELMAFIDDQSPGYDEDSKMTADSCSYNTPGSLNGWHSPDSMSSYNGAVSKNQNYSYQNGQHVNGGYKDDNQDRVSRSPKNINLTNGVRNINLDKDTNGVASKNVRKLNSRDSSSEGEINGASSSSPKHQHSYDGSPSKNKMAMASAGQGSPLRSQLALKLKANTPKRCAPQPSPTVQCLLCDFKSSCPKKLEEHINRAHFDLTSPSIIGNDNTENNPTLGLSNPTLGLSNPTSYNPTIAITSAMALSPGPNTFQCPICEKNFSSGPDVELHVNVDHRDILSPQKNDSDGNNPAGACSNEIEKETNNCPLCGQIMSPNDMNFLEGTKSDIGLFIAEVYISGVFMGKVVIGPSFQMEHIEDHFSRGEQALSEAEREAQRNREEHEFQLLRAQYGMEEDEDSSGYADRTAHGLKKAVYSGALSVAGYYERSVGIKKAAAAGRDDGCSRTTGLLEKISQLNSQSSGILKTYLCSAVDHYASTYGDRGWGCGYRNMQMLLSCLVRAPEYVCLLSQGWSGASEMHIPSIPTLQLLVERAWQLGFDTQGSEQLGCKLYNTTKWIGACEVITVLSSLRIKCSLIDFHKPTGADGGHPALFEWVYKYFDENPDEFKPPLYLQHQGHSRTIIGYERHKDGKATLLVLDPSHAPAEVRQVLSSNTATGIAAVRLLRRGSSALRARQYQLLAITGVIQDQAQYEASKVLQSVRIP